MQSVSVVEVDGSPCLLLKCAYEESDLARAAGGLWNKEQKGWVLGLSDYDLTKIKKKFPRAMYSPSIAEFLAMEEERKAATLAVREAATRNDEPDFKLNTTIPLFKYQMWAVRFARANTTGYILADSPGLGKALPVTAPVFTATGKTCMGKLKVGDEVMCPDGLPHAVTGVFPQGQKQVYKITFSDKTYTECCRDHLWEVKIPMMPKPVVLSTKKLFNEIAGSKGTKAVFNGVRWAIPMTEPVRFTHSCSDTELDFYMLGVALNLARYERGKVHLRFCGDELPIADKILKDVPCLDRIERTGVEGKSVEYITDALNSKFIEFGIYGFKKQDRKIPRYTLTEGLEHRVALLHGLLDSNGSLIRSGNFTLVKYTCSSEMLANDVACLIQSLGGTAIKAPEGKSAWIVKMRFPMAISPFTLETKLARYKPSGRPPSRKIVSIEKTNKFVDMVCITVDSPGNLYLTNNFIATHNTAVSIATALDMENRIGCKKVLVVCPAAVKFNWADEIQKFSDKSFTVVNGTAKKREKQWLEKSFFKICNYETLRDLFSIVKRRKPSAPPPRSMQELLNSAPTKERMSDKKEIAEIANTVWDLVIFDEAHYLKSVATDRHNAAKMLKSRYKLLLTGTPVDARLEELHSLLSIVAPYVLGSRSGFMKRYVDTDMFGNAVGYKKLDEVKERVSPYLLRRLKRDVLSELPPKTYRNIYVEFPKDLKQIYDDLLEGDMEEIDEAQAAVKLVRARQFCNNPDVVFAEEKRNPKMDALMDLLQESVKDNAQKAIIFSMSTKTLTRIGKRLSAAGYKYLRIDGSTDAELRQDYCKQFNTDPTVDIIIGSEAMSTGVNLPAAELVVNYDDNWSPAIMLQREDRAHRANTKHPVLVVNFICVGTVEEAVRGTIYNKRVFSTDILSDKITDTELHRMSNKELLATLTDNSKFFAKKQKEQPKHQDEEEDW